MPLTDEQKEVVLQKNITDSMTEEEMKFVKAALHKAMLHRAYSKILHYWTAVDPNKALFMMSHFVTEDGNWISDLPDPIPEEWLY